jgi:uncharacterized protein (DUF433 family)
MKSREGSDAAVSLSPAPPRASWVEKTPGVCGGDACIRQTRHTVWGLVEWRRLGRSDAEILERHPDLTAGDLEAAWEYHDQHSKEIDQAIRENEEA